MVSTTVRTASFGFGKRCAIRQANLCFTYAADEFELQHSHCFDDYLALLAERESK